MSNSAKRRRGAEAVATSAAAIPSRGGAAAGGGDVSPPPSRTDLLALQLKGIHVDPTTLAQAALREVLMEIEVLKTKNEGLERLQAACQPGQPDWNALQGAIVANNATLQTLREQEEKHSAEIKDLQQRQTAGNGGGGAAAAATGARCAVFQRSPLQPFVPRQVGEEKDRLVCVGHLDAAGLASAHPAEGVILYMRDEAVQLRGALEGLGSLQLVIGFGEGVPCRGAYVSGPPGTGKSSISWLWACQRSASESVLWIHIDEARRWWVVEMPHRQSWKISRGTDVKDIIKPLFDNFYGSLAVVDGMTKQLRKEGLAGAPVAWAADMDHRRVIMVSSLQMVPPGEVLQMERMTMIEVGSWSKEELLAALQRRVFLNQVQANVGVFEGKYFFAGSSARWMFGMDLDEARRDIERWISKDIDARALLSGVQGPASDPAVNHLVQRFRGAARQWRYTIVSEFVARELAEKCNLAFVRAAQQQARENPSFQGWVYEMAFLCRLRLCEGQDGIRVGEASNREVWTVSRRLRPYYVSELRGERVQDGGPERYLNVLGVSHGDWIIMRVFNQGGFDLFQILQHDGNTGGTWLRVVQLSRANSHSLKLKYVVELVRVLGAIGFQVQKVDFVFVVPESRLRSFRVEPPTGRLDELHVLNSAGSIWRHPCQYGDYRIVAWDLDGGD